MTETIKQRAHDLIDALPDDALEHGGGGWSARQAKRSKSDLIAEICDFCILL